MEVDLRIDLDPGHTSLELANLSEGLYRLQVAPVGAILPLEVVLEESGRHPFLGRIAPPQSWGAINASKSWTSIQHATMRSVRRTSKGVGLSPAISSRIMSRRPDNASSVSGDPPEAVSISKCWALRPISEALAITAGDDSRSFCLSSRLASLSPSSALFERSRSSSRHSFTSVDS